MITDLKKKYCVGLGEILFDVFPTGSQLGGAPANFAYHAGQHGLLSVAVSAVGNDAFGEEALRQLDEKGLKHIMPKVNWPTGTVQVKLDSDGYLHTISRLMWHGTTFLSLPMLRRLLLIQVLFVGARWLSATRLAATPSISSLTILQRIA